MRPRRLLAVTGLLTVLLTGCGSAAVSGTSTVSGTSSTVSGTSSTIPSAATTPWSIPTGTVPFAALGPNDERTTVMVDQDAFRAAADRMNEALKAKEPPGTYFGFGAYPDGNPLPEARCVRGAASAAEKAEGIANGMPAAMANDLPACTHLSPSERAALVASVK